MKAVFSISMAFLIFMGSLMPNVDMDELTKIPYLVEHYMEHCKNEKAISFSKFISMHYDSDSKHSKSPEHEPEHEKMPFFHHGVPNLLFVMGTELSFSPLHLIESKPMNVPTFNHYTFISSISLFQPPKQG